MQKLNNNSKYWVSSRSINIAQDTVWYDVRYVIPGDRIDVSTRYNSANEIFEKSYSLRPVITLNSNVQIDITKTCDGKSAETAYIIK